MAASGVQSLSRLFSISSEGEKSLIIGVIQVQIEIEKSTPRVSQCLSIASQEKYVENFLPKNLVSVKKQRYYFSTADFKLHTIKWEIGEPPFLPHFLATKKQSPKLNGYVFLPLLCVYVNGSLSPKNGGANIV